MSDPIIHIHHPEHLRFKLRVIFLLLIAFAGIFAVARELGNWSLLWLIPIFANGLLVIRSKGQNLATLLVGLLVAFVLLLAGTMIHFFVFPSSYGGTLPPMELAENEPVRGHLMGFHLILSFATIIVGSFGCFWALVEDFLFGIVISIILLACFISSVLVYLMYF